MDAVRSQVETTRNALDLAVAKAGLTGDPVGQALQGLSLSIGAQLSLHEAAVAHFAEVAARLDQAVVDAVAQGEQALQMRRDAIVEALAPQLVEVTQRSVRSWNRAVTTRTLLAVAVAAVAGTVAVGSVGFAIGWKVGEASAMRDKAVVASAIDQAGPEAAAALAQLVRNNDLPSTLADCRKNSVVQDGRHACAMPIWLELGKGPARSH